MKKILVMMMAVTALVGCSKDDQKNEDPIGSNKEIMVGATTLSVDAISRAPINTIPEEGLLARVPVSNKDGVYKSEWQENEGYMKFMKANTITRFTDVSGATETPKFYPTSDESIYLCGLYPANNWVIDESEGTTATYTFTGKEDVMAAQQVTTSKADAPNNFKTLNFAHLLTQLRIQFKAVSETAAEAWGDIIKLELLDKEGAAITNQVTVNLKEGTATFEKGTETLTFYQMTGKDKGNDTPYAATGMTRDAVYKAYILCPSVTADGTEKAEYQLKITSAGGATETVNISLKNSNSSEYNGYTAGKAFDIILSFQATEIKAMATITPWTDMGTTEVPVGGE